MAEIWNIIINKFINIFPKKLKSKKAYNVEKNLRRDKFFSNKTFAKYLKFLENYEDKRILIKYIQDYNWNYLNFFRFSSSEHINTLIDTILELGVDVSKIKITGYGSCGFFLFIRSNFTYFEFQGYEILWRRLNYFRNVLLNDIDEDLKRRNLFYAYAFNYNSSYCEILLKMGIDINKHINYLNGPIYTQSKLQNFCGYVDHENNQKYNINILLKAMINADRDINSLPMTDREKKYLFCIFRTTKRKKKSDFEVAKY